MAREGPIDRDTANLTIMSDDENQRSGSPGEDYVPVDADDDDVLDENTLRIMVSTDNHLGYAEKDPIRGLDSFAAFEEVLFLAKSNKCDMVLLAGDLFHDNKPSRRTMHKTMEIVRRYCMGSDPVQIQVVSDQATDFRNINGTVNYEDEFYSIDLPIFTIHGNHDDPTRDGGTEMLAALDLLAVSNLVNYFGRQDEVDKVEVSPVLLKKGTTKVAIYGMGSMRDERLNRMWQGKKVRFLEPDEPEVEDEDNEDEMPWFNIFALHQNRDLGRGSKNCVHESMIPDWMDLIIWGHEHECNIIPLESAVGTFRISQPGSSVATSLTAGESERKQVGILDVRGNDYRLRPIPLSQVRSFVAADISLKENENVALDPEDPDIDEAMGVLLADRVTKLVEEARNQAEILRQDASAEAAKSIGGHNIPKMKYSLIEPNQVLVRLKVEHSGFSTLNNQRFGSRFVGEVANPADILLFYRRRQVETIKGDKKGKKGPNSLRVALDEPMEPEDLAEINVEDLIAENLETATERLMVLDEQHLSTALEEFVAKEQRHALDETVEGVLLEQQSILFNRGKSKKSENDAKITTAAALKDVINKEARKGTLEARNGSATQNRSEEFSDDSDDGGKTKRLTNAASAREKKASVVRGNLSKSKSRKKEPNNPPSEHSEDEEIEVIEARKKSQRSARPARKTAAAAKKYTYDEGSDDESDFVADDDDENESDFEATKQSRKQNARRRASSPKRSASNRSKASSSSNGRGGSSAFTSARKNKQPTNSTRRKRGAISIDDSDDDISSSNFAVGADWGTASSQSQLKRSKR